MAKYANIVNGVVVCTSCDCCDGFIEVDDYVVCGMRRDDTGVFYLPTALYVWDGSEYIRGVNATLECIKDKAKSLQSFGYTHSDGNTYQIRENPNDIANFDRIARQISDGIESPHGGIWRTIGNVMVPKTDVEMKDLADSATMYAGGIWRAKSLHVDKISQMTDAQAAAYDVDEGWP